MPLDALRHGDLGPDSVIHRIERVVFGTLLVALALAFFAVLWSELAGRRQAFETQSRVWLAGLAVQLESSMQFMDAIAAAELASQARRYPHFQAITVFTSGSISSAGGEPVVRFQDLGQMPIRSIEEALPTRGKHPLEPSIVIRQPIQGPTGDLGQVVVRLGTEHLWSDFFKFAGLLGFATAIAGVSAGFIMRKMLRKLMQPLLVMQQTMAEVATSSDYSRRVQANGLNGRDEFAHLAQGLNAMLAQVEARDALLAQSNQTMLALKNAAERATESKTQFLSTMSHELRTPLAGVIGLLKLVLRDSTLSKPDQERLQRARANAKTLMTMVNELLDMAKIEAGKITIEHIEFSVFAVVDDAVALLAEFAEEKLLDLRLEIDSAVPQWLRGDPVRIRQVLINLIGNALKFTSTGSVQVVVTRAPMSDAADPQPGELVRLRFAVIDTGIGIEAKALDRLFDRFEQADSTTTRRFGGTGLGLAICKELVEMMDGQIGVDSRLGHGSTFHFELPLLMCQDPAHEVGVSRDASKYSLEVLVAEDIDTNQLLVRSLLEDQGHRCTIAADGEQALHQLASGNRFDVVIMDIRMPHMDGIAATRHLRSGRWGELSFPEPNLPVIGASANDSGSDRRACLAAGMNDLMGKPLEEGLLRRALHSVVEQRLAEGVTLRDKLLTTANLVDDLRPRLLEMFGTAAPERLQQIEAALRADDWDAAAMVMHSIKGSAAYLWPDGALTRQAAEMEELAEQRRSDDFRAALPKLRAALDQSLRQG